jgi:hypothetical protein
MVEDYITHELQSRHVFLTHNLNGKYINTNEYAPNLNTQSTTPYAPIVTKLCWGYA